ncbi:hypothetical protein RHGRI_029949 [Rhododendron griersonianum]|uniref:Uncharacterized protein n=1 Tax=Rhododendron griersonianum TaxID=479676 RepID=A0AAV6IPL4_9ERIC|nr:hypothetical protein RHGRI_029949 [Rhododendron griersonianum]
MIRISLGILVLDLVEYHKQPCQLEAKNQEKSSSFEGDDNKKKSINDEFQLADQPEKGCCRTKGRGGWLRFYQDQLRRGRPFTEHELEDYIKCIERSEGFDVGNVPDNISDFNMLIRPIRFPDLKLRCAAQFKEKLEGYAKLALECYNLNNKEPTKYQFVKYLKANN